MRNPSISRYIDSNESLYPASMSEEGTHCSSASSARRELGCRFRFALAREARRRKQVVHGRRCVHWEKHKNVSSVEFVSCVAGKGSSTSAKK